MHIGIKIKASSTKRYLLQKNYAWQVFHVDSSGLRPPPTNDDEDSSVRA